MAFSFNVIMKIIIKEFGDVALSLIGGILVLGIFFSVLFSNILPIGAEVIEINASNKVLNNNKLVSIKNFIVKDGYVRKGEAFDYKDRIIATNSRDENISNFVSIVNAVDTSSIGEKEVTYVLRYNGEKRVGRAKVFVEECLEEEDENYG